MSLSPFPKRPISDSFKFETSADDKDNVGTHKNTRIKLSHRAEKKNIVGKGENAGYQHFLLSNNVFFFSKRASLIVS